MTTTSLLVLAIGSGAAQAAESCSAYPTGTAEKIESSDLASKFGAVPKPSKELRFAYVTKTLINEFWQDVAAGVKNEAAKYGIKVDVQAAKDKIMDRSSSTSLRQLPRRSLMRCFCRRSGTRTSRR